MWAASADVLASAMARSECDAGLVVAAELHQERAAHAEEMEIIRQPLAQRLDHLERCFRPPHLGYPRPRG